MSTLYFEPELLQRQSLLFRRIGLHFLQELFGRIGQRILKSELYIVIVPRTYQANFMNTVPISLRSNGVIRTTTRTAL
ncbi:MAG: hypothetical protein A3E08_01100 [Candidatus Wildermuthbacteria bacterium RIFCSPHIGHO2_12_FULL_49_13]|nr:MAG: hypothetical protein A2674_01765 [Candidatus Wildermuthbacteria bacterium RIFCSPHIGHO2_01_FULL_50_47]OHA72690.1 MAG: hypothetical protein A3E08_01100 [Candidatus Wildermuthbacteria bacterium RIFCSPHIGHO2_12_FULL_49_13]OHA77890.1 MAG: hypothetical protein A2564_01420 [Candidatus Wildermuthbacteria bacterium RIFOXYD1_FULL_50_12]